MKKTYNKLIRDRIAEIIVSHGDEPKISTLNKKEYFVELKKKVLEEGKELVESEKRADIINELTDILELIDAIAKEKKIDPKDLKSAQKLKRFERGGFDKKIFLHYVNENISGSSK